MPIIYDSFETCEISVNLIGVLDYLICIPRPLAWGVFRSKTLQRYNKSLNYANNSAFFVNLQYIARLVYHCVSDQWGPRHNLLWWGERRQELLCRFSRAVSTAAISLSNACAKVLQKKERRKGFSLYALISHNYEVFNV